MTRPLPVATQVYGLAVTLLVAGFCLDESTCLWYMLAGWRCPGCGMIHAMLAMARSRSVH
jgi:hypothetical protein